MKKLALAVALFFVATIALADGQIILNTSQTIIASTAIEMHADVVGFTDPTNVEIKYGTTSLAEDNTTGVFQIQPADTTLTKTISGLTPDTDYWFQIVGEVSGTQYISPALFRTSATGGVNAGTTGTPSAGVQCAQGTDGYCLLAPIGGVSVITDAQLSDYFGMIYKILIGLAGVLAVIMIFFGGVQYMTSDALSNKNEGRTRITNAVIGLIIALGSYAILNTVNPKLLDFTFGIDKVQLSYKADEQIFSQTEEQTAPNAGYTMAGTFFNPVPSAGVAAAAVKLNANYQIQQITVDTAARTATFTISNGTANESFSVPIQIGKNGVAEIGQSHSGDGKTPKGTTYINSDRRLSLNQTNAIFDRSGKYNMGAAFINIGTNPDRGIGFHGKSSNTLTVTNGCIRMFNDDLVVLAPYMKSGTKVVIQ